MPSLAWLSCLMQPPFRWFFIYYGWRRISHAQAGSAVESGHSDFGAWEPMDLDAMLGGSDSAKSTSPPKGATTSPSRRQIKSPSKSPQRSSRGSQPNGGGRSSSSSPTKKKPGGGGGQRTSSGGVRSSGSGAAADTPLKLPSIVRPGSSGSNGLGVGKTAGGRIGVGKTAGGKIGGGRNRTGSRERTTPLIKMILQDCQAAINVVKPDTNPFALLGWARVLFRLYTVSVFVWSLHVCTFSR